MAELPPQELTPKLAEAIIRAVARGALPESAAAAEGVWEGTFDKWLERGRQEESGPYHQFVIDLDRTENELIARGMRCLAHVGDPVAIRWLQDRGLPLDDPADRFVKVLVAPQNPTSPSRRRTPAARKKSTKRTGLKSKPGKKNSAKSRGGKGKGGGGGGGG